MNYVTTPYPLEPLKPFLDDDEIAAFAVQRTWNAKEEDFPSGQALGLASLSATTMELLLCAGLAAGLGDTVEEKTVWRSAAADLKRLTKDGTLRLVPSYRDTRSLSEDFGEALAHYVLFRHYGIKHIARVGHFLVPKSGTTVGTGVYQGKGLVKSTKQKTQPDYFCLTGDRQVVIADAKGASGLVGALKGPLEHGVKQVEAVNPVGCTLRPEPNRLVIGTHFPIDGKHTGNATTVVRDPESGEEPLQIQISADQLIRRSLANVLRVVGLVPESLLLLNGQRQTSRFERLYAEDRGLNRRDVIALAPLTGDWWLTLTPSIWDAIRRSQESLAHVEWPEYLATENEVTLPNGFGMARRPEPLPGRSQVFMSGTSVSNGAGYLVGVELVDVLSKQNGMLSPRSLLTCAVARRRLSPGALLTAEELCLCWLRRDQINLADPEIRDLLIRSALRRPGTLFLWLAKLAADDEILTHVLLSSPFDSDRDVSDAAKVMLEVGAMVLLDHDLHAMLDGMQATAYKHFRDAIKHWMGPEEQRRWTVNRPAQTTLNGKSLKSLPADELWKAADDLTEQLMTGTGYRTVTSQLMNVGRALLVGQWPQATRRASSRHEAEGLLAAPAGN